MEKTITLIAYGTLRKGGSNQRVLKEATFLESTIVLKGYSMYIVGYYPLVVEDQNRQGTCDLFSVPAEHLERLDHFKGRFTEE